MRKRIYIAGPISKGDLLHNVQQADDAACALIKAGLAVFNPMLSVYSGGAVRAPSGSGEPVAPVVAYADRQANGPFRDISHADWLDMDFAWIAVSDAVLRLPGESSGADMEVAEATARGIPVFFSVADVVEWAKSQG